MHVSDVSTYAVHGAGEWEDSNHLGGLAETLSKNLFVVRGKRLNVRMKGDMKT